MENIKLGHQGIIYSNESSQFFDQVKLQIETTTRTSPILCSSLNFNKVLRDIGEDSLDFVVSFPDSNNGESLLFEYYRALKPCGRLLMIESLLNRTYETSQNLSRRLLLSGFVDTTITDFQVENSILFMAVKPEWAGTSEKLKLNQWKNDVEDDIMDENDLVEENDFVKPTKFDCGPGLKKKHPVKIVHVVYQKQ